MQKKNLKRIFRALLVLEYRLIKQNNFAFYFPELCLDMLK